MTDGDIALNLGILAAEFVQISGAVDRPSLCRSDGHGAGAGAGIVDGASNPPGDDGRGFHRGGRVLGPHLRPGDGSAIPRPIHHAPIGQALSSPQYDHGRGRDFAAGAGGEPDAIEKRVSRRLGPGIHPELIKLAAQEGHGRPTGHARAPSRPTKPPSRSPSPRGTLPPEKSWRTHVADNCFGVVGPEHRRAADPRTPPIDGRRPKLTRDVVERIAIRLHDESPAGPGSRRR
jgi:hypothetical protein